MIYLYRCTMCGNESEILKPMALASREEICPECEITLNRIYTPINIMLMSNTPKERDEIRAAKYERGSDLVCVGNERKAFEAIKPAASEYELPKEVTSTFEN